MAAQRPKAGLRAARVREIVAAMSDGTYTGTREERLKMRQEWATRWAVSLGAIEHYAAEAHRVMALDPSERKVLQRDMVARYQRILDRVDSMTSKQTGMPDFKSELEAMRDLRDFLGLTEATTADEATERPHKIRIVLTRPPATKKPEGSE